MPAYPKGFVAPRPGGIDLESVTITNFDGSETEEVKLLTMEFSVYESLGCDHLRGDLLINDTLALVSRMPIVGDETVSMTFRTPSETPDSREYEMVKVSFKCVKLEKLQTGNIRDEWYNLVLVSQERIADLKTIVQDLLEGMASTLVYKVASEYLGITDIRMGAAASRHQFVIPTMTPMETIHFIASEARSAAVHSSNYVFFADHGTPQGKTGYNFITTEELAAMNAKETYYVTEQSLTGQTGSSSPLTQRQTPLIDNTDLELTEKHNSKEWRCMHSIVFEKTFDAEPNLRQGMYDNIAYWIDPIMQEYMAAGTGTALGGQATSALGGGGTTSGTTSSALGGAAGAATAALKYLDVFPVFKHTAQRDTGQAVISAGSPYANGTGESSIRYLVSNKNQGMNFNFMVVPRQRQDFVEMLSSYIGQNDSIVCTLTVPGDSNRKAGDTIFFNLHEIGATDDIMFELNKYLSGKFLVTAVRHKYNFETGYVTMMQCIKNCFEAEITNAPGGP